MIPSTVTPLQCVPLKNVADIRYILEDDKNHNGVNLVIQYLRESYFNLRKHVESLIWMFDEDKDTIKSDDYDQVTKMTMPERIKHTVSYLHDKMIEEFYNFMKNVIKKQKLTIQEGYKIIKYANKNIFKLNTKENSKVYNDIELLLFKSLDNLKSFYDKNDDIVYGLEFEDEKINKNKKLSDSEIEIESEIKEVGESGDISIAKINLSKIGKYGKIEKKEVIDGICQHVVIQDKISSIGKKDYTKYSDEIYKFQQQYVYVNAEGENVCKSCGYYLNIKKYIVEGEYDDESRQFVSYSTPIDINLEDILGYEKYKNVIKNMDKIVERIATISNILHLTKSTVVVKSKRKLVVKNAIDLILSHNKYLKNKSKRGESTDNKKIYNVKQYSNLFNFELDNSIFTFSSEEKDKYKGIKTNNIIVYIIFIMIMELNNSHVIFIGDDKKNIVILIHLLKVLIHCLQI